MTIKFFKWLLAFLLLFSLVPFICLCSGTKNRETFFREISYRIIYDHLAENSKDDSSKAIHIFNLIHQNVSDAPKSLSPKDSSPFDIIIDSVGFCDQQANLMMTIAGIGGIKGNLIFLNGFDCISHHAVCELKIDGKYRMFDPFYNQILTKKNNEIASLKDIQNGNEKQPKNISLLPKEYFKWFEKKYPYKIAMTNETPLIKKIARVGINTWYKLFGKVLLKPFISAYFILDNVSEIKKNRITRLLINS